MTADVTVPVSAVTPERSSRLRRAFTGGQALFPLVVLFGLNAVDQADQRRVGFISGAS